ncbi:hypothetical protein BV25DRAFT_1819692 [Artomyces pyxidatus]|uniref:Uncharacterized protein n=1 Tax=Artomyces pyxidatus TaxID=48021 RepID=A0ACB8TFZ4_9AGAM|nr:hypothetical protein BV25DRAFT_1819692 [Artomyces pyxidatus]
MPSTTVLISTFPPFPTLAFSVPSESTLDDVYGDILSRYDFIPPFADLYLSHVSGHSCHSSTLASLSSQSSDHAAIPVVSLRLAPRMRGGKGGFGSQLRAAGGRMSSQKTSNNDSCRDLSGRRLSTIKEGKRLAEYLEQEPARKKAAAEAQRAKLEALERKLGIDPKAGPSSSGVDEPQPLAGKKHRFDDSEYLEQSRDIVENVKNAVTAGLLKKKKKAKTSHTTPSDGIPTKDTANAVPNSTTESALAAEKFSSTSTSSSITAVVGA